MATKDPSAAADAEFLGELRLGRHLTTSGQVAARGLMIVAALVVLMPGHLASLFGRSAVLASLLAGIVLGLSLWNALELLGGAGDVGSTYLLVHQTLGGLGAFLTGWILLAGCVAQLAAFLRAAAEQALAALPMLRLSSVSVALGLLGLLVMVMLLQPQRRRPWGWPVLLVLLATLGLASGSARSLSWSAAVQQSPLTHLGDYVRGMALATPFYFALEAVLASRRQIRNARRDLPHAALVVLLAATLLLGLAVSAAVALRDPSDPSGWIGAFADAGRVPGALVRLLAIVALVLGARSCLRLAVSQFYGLVLTGALPPMLMRIRQASGVPHLPFGLLSVSIWLLLVLVPTQWLIELAAVMARVAMTLLDIAAFHGHRAQPERRRWSATPFPPLVPVLAIVANLVLLRALRGPGGWAAAWWMLAGALVYFGYGRRRQAEARAAVCVFGPELHEKAAGAYRILVPIGSHENRRLLLNLATALACQREGEVIPLQVIPTPDPLGIEESQRTARELNALFRWSVRLGAGASVPIFPMTRLAHSVPEGVLDAAAEEKCDLIMMSWLEEPPSRRRQLGRVLDPVVRGAPCDVAVLALSREDMRRENGEERFRPSRCSRPIDEEAGAGLERVSRVMVSAGSGPHTALAMSLALSLAQEYGASVTAIYVAEPGAGADEVAAGVEQMEQTISSVGEQAGATAPISVQSRVVEAEDVVRGISRQAADYDIVLLGASEESLIDQMVFGSVPERVARASFKPVLMAKKHRRMPRLWLQQLWNALSGALPKLSAREQAEVYRALRRGARPDVDFFVMMGLAAVIATFGILQSSTAVIIGAMLVAPLFTPITALSMAVARGDGRLLALAAESTIKGIVLAVGLGATLAWLSPLVGITSEITVRSQPSLPDLVVALASGAAGAYAVARKDVAASLPGVGIAAALVPPLCTVGISLTLGELRVAGGAGLLFFTNLIAIMLAGAVMLLLLGFRPGQRKGGEMAAMRRGLLAAVMLLLLIAIPLMLVFVDSVNHSRLTSAIKDYLNRELPLAAGADWTEVQVDDEGTEIVVTATVYASEALSPDVAASLSSGLSQTLGRPVRLRLATILLSEGLSLPKRP